MTIKTCQECARASGKKVFDFVTPNKTAKAKWIDVWLGLFELEGIGNLWVDEVQFSYDYSCINLRKEGE